MAEALKKLRVNLGFRGGNLKVIITSNVKGEGNSFVTKHLWKQMAEVGLVVLLMDCSLHSEETGRGLAQYLVVQAQLEDILCQTNLPNGYVLPTGIILRFFLLGKDFTKWWSGAGKSWVTSSAMRCMVPIRVSSRRGRKPQQYPLRLSERSLFSDSGC